MASEANFGKQVEEVSLLAMQAKLKKIKSTEFVMLVQRYKDTLSHYEKKKDTDSELKLVEQLVLSIPVVLLHDQKLKKMLGADGHASLVYNVRAEMEVLLDMIESKYNE